MSTPTTGWPYPTVPVDGEITVDEEGTEAAAATAVAMAGTSAPAPEETVELTIDRPFTFWLHDTSAQVIVFAGRVNDPSATRG